MAVARIFDPQSRQWLPVATGAQGPRGPKGNDGAGIPTGGEPGQVPVRTEDGGTRWEDLPTPVLDDATPSAAGLMPAADKAKLNRYPSEPATLTAQANQYTDEQITALAPAHAPLADQLIAPTVIAHRGGGALVYPEQGIRGMIAAAEAGFLPEVDVQFLADGTPVLCHDATVDRTMTGVTGPVSGLTLADWRRARLRPIYRGGRDDSPMTFADALDLLGGRVVLVPEIKRGASVAQIDACLELIHERGLARSVLMQSFDFAACERIAAAGLEVVYLTGTGAPSVSWSVIRAAGIRYWGPTTVTPASVLDAAASAGLRVLPYTTRAPWEADALPASVFGYFSDDPWGDSRRLPQAGAPSWEVGEGWPAPLNLAHITGSAGGGVRRWEEGPAISGGRLLVPSPGHVSSDLSMFSMSVEHLTGRFVDRPCRMSVAFRFLPDNSGSDGNVGFHLIRNDHESRAYDDNAVPGQNGFTAAVRRTGQIAVWEYRNGAAANRLALADPASQPEFTLNESDLLTFVLEVTATGVAIKCPSLRVSATASTNLAGPFRPYLRVTRTAALIESISVTPL